MNSVHNPSIAISNPAPAQPENGPRILFFSGGTAINALSKRLTQRTHRAIHLVTPFDSGGSSANLRTSFDMPSVGDLRSRMVALADDQPEQQPIKALFDRRLSNTASQASLLAQLHQLVQGDSPEFHDMEVPVQLILRDHLALFLRNMPSSFDLKGASVGNLILTGGYLQAGRQLEPVIQQYSRLLRTLGTVTLSSNEHLHLMTDLEDGTRLFGQHRLTGKEHPPITQPVKRLRLSALSDQWQPTQPQTPERIRQLILSADLICYPPGSFYSSLLANLLPDGIRQAISNNPCPKVYIPNLGHDPEQLGKSTQQLLQTLLTHLSADQTPSPYPHLTHVLMDTSNGNYAGRLQIDWLHQHQLQLLDTTLIRRARSPFYDNTLLIDALFTLI